MKIIAKNRRARFDYNITDIMIAGLVLTGPEVKSIKDGHISLKGAYVRFVDSVPVITGAHISPYKFAGKTPHEETRDRKLLLNKSEIERLINLRATGQQAVPVSIGIERGLVKMELGIGTSRQKHDKRQAIKAREAAHDIKRVL